MGGNIIEVFFQIFTRRDYSKWRTKKHTILIKTTNCFGRNCHGTTCFKQISGGGELSWNFLLTKHRGHVFWNGLFQKMYWGKSSWNNDAEKIRWGKLS